MGGGKNNGARDEQPKTRTQARGIFDLLLRHGKLPRAALPALRAGHADEGQKRHAGLGGAREGKGRKENKKGG